LPLQLTHFAKWPRTDTFGELSFVLSFVAFVAYRLTREQSPER
jgi:flagellar biogenesis protein FliO